ncbi:MAG: hypothetical protein VW684_11160, partial [Betaproteobacteria bacterium]
SSDIDGDLIGDNADLDDDGDGIPDDQDSDPDGDGIQDRAESCIFTDGDVDSDGDGLADCEDPNPLASDVVAGKAIDGYLVGATVFLDLNWNLKLDTGEPVAITDPSGQFRFAPWQSYKVLGDQPGVCARQRPQVVIAEAGTVDLQRGPIEKDLKLVLIPSPEFSSDNEFTLQSVTPLTSLFKRFIFEAKQESNYVTPALDRACEGPSSELYESVWNKVSNFSADLENQTGVSIDSLYADFIEDGDQELSDKAYRLSAFLSAQNSIAEALSESLEQQYGVDIPVSVDFEEDTLRRVVSSNEFDSLELNFRAYFNDRTSEWAPNFWSEFVGIGISSSGKILSPGCALEGGCEGVDISLEAILDNATNLMTSRGLVNRDLIPGVDITDATAEGRIEPECGLGSVCPASTDIQRQIEHNIGADFTDACLARQETSPNPFFNVQVQEFNSYDSNHPHPEGWDQESVGISIR